MFDAPQDRGVKVISSQSRPKLMYDPKWYWHYEPKQIRPSDELVWFSKGE